VSIALAVGLQLGVPGCGRIAAPGALVRHDIWTVLQDSDEAPTPGEDCAIAYVHPQGSVFLYGGKGDGDQNTSDLWRFAVSTRRWSRITSEGPTPPPREDHTLIFDEANGALVLYGGENGTASHDTWVFDLATRRWTDITQAAAPYREDHTAVYDPKRQRMVVFGGRDEEGRPTDDTWALTLDRSSPEHGAWRRLLTGESVPSARSEHAAAYDPARHRLLIFGGRLTHKRRYTHDVWALDLDGDRWTQLVAHGDGPLPIRQSVMGLNQRTRELVVFGGDLVGEASREDYLVNSIWVLDLESLRWTDRTPSPESVRDHVGVFVPEYDGMLVYGGTNYRAAKQRATWLLRPSRTTSFRTTAH
jgi:hypothetical protein